MSMKKNSALLLIALILLPCLSFALSPQHGASDDPFDTAAIRAEFDALFAESPIYSAIRKHLPEEYETFFNTYLAAKRMGAEEIDIAGFIASIRNTYLKQSCDESILEFFRYTAATGRDLLAKDPEAAFSYLIGGDSDTYEKHLDFAGQQKDLGRLFDRMLSTASPENVADLNRTEVDSGLDYVYVLLYYKHGENFSLLTRNTGKLSNTERQQLLAIYLDMYEEIFDLVPTTRSNVLRSMAMKM
jgi:hypothetical protein